MKTIRPSISLILFLLAALPSLAAPASILKLLPANNEISGWTQKGPPRVFVNEKLWEFMDGGADVYLDYGFKQIATVEVQQGKNSVTADIYEMKSIDGAFGIFSRESAPTYHYTKIGADGYQEGVALNFYQSNYYVKLNAYIDNAVTKEALRKIAESISKKIGGGKAPPAMMGSFPQEGCIPHSGNFEVKTSLGRKELKEAYSARFNFRGRTYTLLLCNAQNKSNAAQRIKALKSSAANLANVEKEAAGLGDMAVAVKNSEAKELLAVSKGKYIAGIYPAGDGKTSRELLKELLKKLN
jgi:hypothetical protein